MTKGTYKAIKRDHTIVSDNEVLDAIELVQSLLSAEREHLENTEPHAKTNIILLRQAYQELDDLESNLSDLME